MPVPTNWGYSPNNWMVDENGVFTGIIDFENMLWRLPYDSFGVITERYTFDKPLLEEALFDGYGLPKDEVTGIKMKILSAKLCFADIYSGYISNNPRFLNCGRRMLLRLMENVR